MRDAMLKPTILSVSLLTIMASAAVSPALAQIRAAFPDVGPTTVKLILTLPSLVIVPFSLISGWLSARLPKRRLLLAGLVVYVIGGVGGAAARTMPELLALRCVLGAGVGLIMPLSTTLIADFFSGVERTRLMGLSSAVTNVGGVIFLSTAGWLAAVSWRLAFGVYGLALVTLLLVALWLPEPPRPPQTGRSAGARLPAAVFGCAALGALMMVAFYAVPTNLALFIEDERELFVSQRPLFESREDLQQHLRDGTVSPRLRDRFAAEGIRLSPTASLREEEAGRRWLVLDGERRYPITREGAGLAIRAHRLGAPALAGNVLAVMTLSGALAGAAITVLVRRLGRFNVATAIALMSVGFFLLSRAASAVWLFAAVPCIGFSAGVLMPSLLLRVPRVAPPPSRALAMAVVGSAVFLGQFLSPLALAGLTAIAGHDTFRFRFGALSAALAISAVIALASASRAHAGAEPRTTSPEGSPRP